ncbi:hypothetical protein HYPSUDRAFT_634388 [Hypholoma sublateritium FD-334 SS-4]|uniref:Uncharacterized protein n=1 Tax=Hypholoma sublateritium (strain FD-334 SS-4) TaxID=945553 RepID=A0A0D2LM31_HYPSF|nr:hypothetical protein HYPSUDRAFT_634388 [Hypholoma sublateritium FD-334 SS-4]
MTVGRGSFDGARAIFCATSHYPALHAGASASLAYVIFCAARRRAAVASAVDTRQGEKRP